MIQNVAGPLVRWHHCQDFRSIFEGYVGKPENLVQLIALINTNNFDVRNDQYKYINSPPPQTPTPTIISPPQVAKVPPPPRKPGMFESKAKRLKAAELDMKQRQMDDLAKKHNDLMVKLEKDEEKKKAEERKVKYVKLNDEAIFAMLSDSNQLVQLLIRVIGPDDLGKRLEGFYLHYANDGINPWFARILSEAIYPSDSRERAYKLCVLYSEFTSTMQKSIYPNGVPSNFCIFLSFLSFSVKENVNDLAYYISTTKELFTSTVAYDGPKMSETSGPLVHFLTTVICPGETKTRLVEALKYTQPKSTADATAAATTIPPNYPQIVNGVPIIIVVDVKLSTKAAKLARIIVFIKYFFIDVYGIQADSELLRNVIEFYEKLNSVVTEDFTFMAKSLIDVAKKLSLTPQPKNPLLSADVVARKVLTDLILPFNGRKLDLPHGWDMIPNLNYMLNYAAENTGTGDKIADNYIRAFMFILSKERSPHVADILHKKMVDFFSVLERNTKETLWTTHVLRTSDCFSADLEELPESTSNVQVLASYFEHALDSNSVIAHSLFALRLPFGDLIHIAGINKIPMNVLEAKSRENRYKEYYKYLLGEKADRVLPLLEHSLPTPLDPHVHDPVTHEFVAKMVLHLIEILNSFLEEPEMNLALVCIPEVLSLFLGDVLLTNLKTIEFEQLLNFKRYSGLHALNFLRGEFTNVFRRSEDLNSPNHLERFRKNVLFKLITIHHRKQPELETSSKDLLSRFFALLKYDENFMNAENYYVAKMVTDYKFLHEVITIKKTETNKHADEKEFIATLLQTGVENVDANQRRINLAILSMQCLVKVPVNVIADEVSSNNVGRLNLMRQSIMGISPPGTEPESVVSNDYSYLADKAIEKRDKKALSEPETLAKLLEIVDSNSHEGHQLPPACGNSKHIKEMISNKDFYTFLEAYMVEVLEIKEKFIATTLNLIRRHNGRLDGHIYDRECRDYNWFAHILLRVTKLLQDTQHEDLVDIIPLLNPRILANVLRNVHTKLNSITELKTSLQEYANHEYLNKLVGDVEPLNFDDFLGVVARKALNVIDNPEWQEILSYLRLVLSYHHENPPTHATGEGSSPQHEEDVFDCVANLLLQTPDFLTHDDPKIPLKQLMHTSFSKYIPKQ